MPAIASTAEVHPFLKDIRPYMHSIGYHPKDTQSPSSSASYKTHTKTPSTCSSCGSCLSTNLPSDHSTVSYGSHPDVYTRSHSRQASYSNTRRAGDYNRESLDLELSPESASTRANSLEILERKFGKEMAQEAERRSGLVVPSKGKKDKTKRFGRIF